MRAAPRATTRAMKPMRWTIGIEERWAIGPAREDASCPDLCLFARRKRCGRAPLRMRRWTRLEQRAVAGEDFRCTAEELIGLEASKETAASERSRSRRLCTRLRLGMKLQTEPTVIYRIGSAYDAYPPATRRHVVKLHGAGLPPTHRNPAWDALRARSIPLLATRCSSSPAMEPQPRFLGDDGGPNLPRRP